MVPGTEEDIAAVNINNFSMKVEAASIRAVAVDTFQAVVAVDKPLPLHTMAKSLAAEQYYLWRVGGLVALER